jgi:putative aldouronate transport system substrate-binding protein
VITALSLIIPALVFGRGSSAGSAAASTGPTAITIFRDAPSYPSLTSWSNALWVQELEKRCNVKITWIWPPNSSNWEQDINVLLASGNLPDLIPYEWVKYPTGMEGAIKDGIILDWTKKKEYTDLLPNYLRWTTSPDVIRRQLSFDDGSLRPSMTDVITATTEFYVQVITGTRQVLEIPAFLARLKTIGLDRA